MNTINDPDQMIQVCILFDSKYIRLKVKISDTIDSLKTRIRHLEGVDPRNMSLTTAHYPQQALEGKCTLGEYGISNGCFLFLSMEHMVSDKMEIDDEVPTSTILGPESSILRYHISVMTGTGEVLDFEVKSSDTVGDLKSMISSFSGIPSYQLKLFSAQNELVNVFTLAEYGICEDSRLHLLILRESMKIYIQTVMEGKTTGLEVESSHTISMVKAQMDDKEGIPLELQLLFLNGKLLNDDLTLGECNIDHGSTLDLLLASRSGPMRIFVTMVDGRLITLRVRDSETIGNLKMKLQDELAGIRPYNMKLYYNGRQLHNRRTLAHYCIHRDSTLSVFVIQRGRMKITVKALSTGRTLKTLEVRSSNTISRLKALIEDSAGIPPEQQLLLFRGKQLLDHEILASCYIENESTLHLMALSKGIVQILIKMPETSRVMDVRSSETIGSLKERIQQLESIPSHQSLKLLFNGKELADNCSKIQDHNIHWNAVLRLIIVGGSSGMMHITLESDTSRTNILIKTESSVTVEQLKARIWVEHGLSLKHLSYDGNVLNNSRSLAFYHIQDTSILHFTT